jgi:GTP pyrophosphokinase
MFAQNMRVEVQIRSADMHRAAEYGLAAHWAYKQEDVPDGQAGWLRDLLEILETSHDPEELLENTRMAMYQDRIFAFTPKGALHQLPKGSTPVDFAYAVHTDLGDRAVGAKVNGRHVPLRTLLNNGDMVEILSSKAHRPEPAWLNFVATGKARAAIRRHVRHRERGEMVQLGRQLFEDISARVPGRIGAKAIKAALGRLKLPTDDELMLAIGSGKLTDRDVMQALVPGFDPGEDTDWPTPERVISIRGLTPGVAFELGECCHPVPGDRIVGIRRVDQPVEVHTIHCARLDSITDADWVDLSWGQGSDGGAARLRVIIHNRPGMLAEMAGIFGYHKANIINLRLTARDASFHTFEADLEVHDLQHLMRILSALRASDAVAQADRVFG